MNESTAEEKEEQKEKSVPPSQQQQPPLLKTLQNILHNRIIQKNREMHDYHNRAYTDNLWTEIKTLHWVLAQILTLKKIEKNVITPPAGAIAAEGN